jgi:hypothetical protein
MKSHSSLGMMAALALAASAGTGNAVEVISREPDRSPSSPSPFSGGKRKRKSRKRLNVHVAGGNWQGVLYLSYAEHDRCVRKTFGLGSRKSRDFAYHSELEQIIASR